MKKCAVRIISLVTAAVLLFSSCRENAEPVVTVNNGNFSGILMETSSTAATAVPVPQITGKESVDSTENAVESEKNEESSSVTEISSETTTTKVTTTEKTTSETTTSTKKTTTTTAVTTTEKSTTAENTTKITTTKETTTTPKTTTTAETTTTKATTTAETTATTATTTTTEAVTEAIAPVAADEVHGVWISYLEMSVLLKNQSKSDFRKAVDAIYDNCVSLGINTVYVHARAFGDAFYDSELFPATKYLSGTVGVGTDYDPYEILVDEAKKHNLSFHAWINPLRLCTNEDMQTISSDYTIKKWYNSEYKGKYIVNVNGTWYLNPAYDDAVQLVCDGVKEILDNYDVDGIHIDDYFYPTTDASFDSSAFSASGYSSLSSFRINNCNKLVKSLYNTVHDCSASAVFGASTQGSIENNINQLYADAESWCKGGYIDYFAPQIYYGFNNSSQPYEKCTDTWVKMVKNTDVKLYIGLAVYKIGKEDTWAGNGKWEWCNTETMLKRQTEYARSKGCDGIILYSYNYIFTSGYVSSAINKEISNLKPLLTDQKGFLTLYGNF